MNNPLVSILIPVYNTEKYVAEAIESVLNQTYKNIEIIIVDDGSTDKSWEIVESYRQKYPDIIKTHRQKNKGACAARNKALELSSGQYIQYLDADDLISNNKIEEQLRLLLKYNPKNSIVFCSGKKFLGYNVSNTMSILPNIRLHKEQPALEFLLNSEEYYPHMWLIPESLIKQTNGWNEKIRINQDGEFFYRLLTKVDKIYFDNNSICYYRIANPNSISTGYRRKINLKDYFYTLETYKESVLSLTNTTAAKNEIAKRFMQFAFNFYPGDKIYTKKAYDISKAFGKSDVSPTSNRFYDIFVKIFGWKAYTIIRHFFKKDHYGIID